MHPAGPCPGFSAADPRGLRALPRGRLGAFRGTSPCASASPSRCASPQQLLTLAVEAERAGFHSFTVPESLFYPKLSDSKYPYTGDGDRDFLEDKPFIEPFVLMGALGAVTERLRFTTFVVKLPHAAPGAGGEAGHLGGRAHEQPARPRRRPLALARRLPRDERALGRARQAHGRDDRDPARAHARRVLRVPRRALRPRAREALPGADAADPDPDRRPRGRGAAARGPRRRRLDARGRRQGGRPRRRSSRGSRRCGASTGASASPSRST